MVGRFKTNKEAGRPPKELRVALPDACFPHDPIILDPVDASESSEPTAYEPVRLAEAKKDTGRREVKRKVACRPLVVQKQIAGTM